MDLHKYTTEHEHLYRQLISTLDEPRRKRWVDFVESTADYALRQRPLLEPGDEFAGFDALDRAVARANGATDPSVRFLVLGFSFGYSFPFCGLAFKYMARLKEALAAKSARFVCLFPPEDPPPTDEREGYAMIVDEDGAWARACGLRMPLARRFSTLVKEIPWFLAKEPDSTNPHITLPGTCILTLGGVVRWLDLPVDVSCRLPPMEILDRINREALEPVF